jgi:hypothetical protein
MRRLKGLNIKTAILFTFTFILILWSVMQWYFYNNVPDGLQLRVWVRADITSIILFLWQIILIFWTIFIRKIAIRLSDKSTYKIFSKKKVWKILISVLFWMLYIFIFMYLAFCMLFCKLKNYDIETVNENGTITVKWVHFLDSPDYSLYEKRGIMYRKFIREAYGEDDVEPDASYEENEPQGDYDFKLDIEEQKTDLEENKLDLDENKSYEEKGYQAIFDDFLEAVSDEYTDSYDAKGNSRKILHEDDKEIRYIVYDRDSKNDECGLYVYYKCNKNSDGSWSPNDAQIIDIYAYVYKDGNVIDSGRKAWADVGTDEYRKATGE